jgi:hypothetical protein
VDDISKRVPEHLNFDVPRALDIFFDQDMGVPERSGRLALA